MLQNALYKDLKKNKKQRKCYSGKKKKHTIKAQVVIDSNKRVIATSFSIDNMHDFKLFKKSRLPIKPNIKVSVDTGYIGIDKIHSNIEIPKKKSKLNPLSKEDKQNNIQLSSKRVIVEHINAKIKTFKIFGEKYRNRRKRFGLRFNLACALINYDNGFKVA